MKEIDKLAKKEAKALLVKLRILNMSYVDIGLFADALRSEIKKQRG